MYLPITRLAAVLVALSVTTIAVAQTPVDIQRSLEATARQESSGFSGFSAQRGAAFFKATHGNEWSCASCHMQNPTVTGRHARTNKEISPLAPTANVERFTNPAKVEKWFRRNCNDVVGRECSAAEKGDVLAYLMSLNK